MFIPVFYVLLLLLDNINSLYTEIEGVLEPVGHDYLTSSQLEPKKYYWFEIESEICILYFDNSLEFHKRPFLLFIVISEISSETWSEQNICQCLKNTFNIFYKTSEFFSLLPNEQGRNIYVLPRKFLWLGIYGEIELGKMKSYIRMDYLLKPLNTCTSLLETVQIGTIFWNDFYNLNDIFHILFIETYYILYKDIDESSKTVTLFRNGNVIEVAFALFHTKSLKGKFVVSDTKYPIAIICEKNVSVYVRNKYSFIVLVPSPTQITIAFDLQKNKTKQFRLFYGDTELKKCVAMPPIEKLSRVNHRVYSLKNRIQKKMTIEVPVYFFENKVKLSKLVLGFKFIQEKFEVLTKVRVFFKLFNFSEKENCIPIYFESERYHVCFSYIIGSGIVAFKVTRVKDSKLDDLKIVEKEPIRTLEATQTDMHSAFVDGIIIYNKDFFETLTDCDYLNEQENKPIQFNEVNKHISVYLLIVFVTVGGLFYRHRKRTYNNRRFKKIKNK